MRSLQVVRAGLAALVVLAMLLPAGQAYGSSGYDRYRKLRVQSRLYQNLGRPLRAAEALVEAFEAYPDESVLLEAVDVFRTADAPEQALRTAERYLTFSRSPEGRRAAEEHVAALRQELSRDAAEVEIVSDPSGAEVCLLGPEDDCRKTPFIRWLPAGDHHLRAQVAGLPERVNKVTIAPGKHVRIALTLREHVPAGRLDVFARTAQAEITIDGHPAGKAPLTGHALTAGTHVVSVNLGEGDVWRGKIVVEPGRTTTVFAGRAPPATPVSRPVRPTPTAAKETPPPIQISERVIPMPQLTRPMPDHQVAAVEPARPEPMQVANDEPDPLPTVVVAPRPLDSPVVDPVHHDPIDVSPAPIEPAPVVAEPVPVGDEPEPAPVVAEPEPAVVEPDPVAVEPDPVIVEPDPAAVEPDPAIVDPDPAVDEPDPVVADPAPDPDPIIEPEPEIGIVDTTTPANWKVITGWTGVGVGAAALGGAIATSVLALQASDQAASLRSRSSSGDAAEFNRLGSEAENMAMVSNILYPVGGALVAAGVTLLILDMLTEPDDAGSVEAVGFGATPIRGGMVFGTTFEF